MNDFLLPDLGEGVAEAEIDRWLVKEGDEVAEDEPLVEVITDKATVEIPSPWAGEVARIHVQAGQVVPVGTVLVTIAPLGLEEPDIDLREDVIEPLPEEPAAPEEAPSGDPVKATPPVRKLARELGVDISAIAGSGPGGRILRSDVERATLDGIAPQRAAGERREPLRGVRRTIAERMSRSHTTIPSVTHVEECDITELDATRRLANERDETGVRLTYLPFIVKAVVAGLRDHPALNASLDDDAAEIVFHRDYNIGIAVDTPEGLVVPIVQEADRKSLREIAQELEGLVGRARAGELSAEELRGGTFTITSPGTFGGLMATPLILHPQSAILGVHRAMDRPVARDGQIVIRTIMNLSITFDHRILDGMTAARFALDVVRLLEHPGVLALDS